VENEQKPVQDEAAQTEAPEYDLEKGSLKTSVEALMERLGLSGDAPAEGAPSVEELDAAAGEAEAQKDAPEKDAPYDPAKEDWSKFDLDPNIAHYYPKSQIVDLGEGEMAFIAPKVLFKTKSCSTTGAGDYMTEMVNGPEQWQLSALLPNGSGLMVVVLQRVVRVRLPHPTLLPTETPIAAVKDEELQATEDAALSWADGEMTPEKRAVLDKLAFESEMQVADAAPGAVEGADVAE